MSNENIYSIEGFESNETNETNCIKTKENDLNNSIYELVSDEDLEAMLQIDSRNFKNGV